MGQVTYRERSKRLSSALSACGARGRVFRFLTGKFDAMQRDVTANRVLIVDDEPTIREMVGINLRREGIEVISAANGEEALAAVAEHQPDAMVLDIMMPGIDGFEVCRRVRDGSTIPILLLSARGEEVDRVVGLEMGADDFLTKPFAMRELVARVRAMLRRVRMTSQVQSTPATVEHDSSGQIIRAGDVRLDIPRRQAIVGSADISLKPKEFDLLLYFARHPGIVLSRDALIREVWGYAYPVDTRTVDVHVRWLRQKIEADPSDPIRIETVRGVGYRFVSHDD